MKRILATLPFILSPLALAGNDFKCVVKDGVQLGDDGMLNHDTAVGRAYVGREFVVNRATGLISGGGLSNTMSGQVPTVYDYLASENSYKAISVYTPNYTIDYLQINQYVAGKKKPFFFKGAFGTMISGLCLAY